MKMDSKQSHVKWLVIKTLTNYTDVDPNNVKDDEVIVVKDAINITWREFAETEVSKINFGKFGSVINQWQVRQELEDYCIKQSEKMFKTVKTVKTTQILNS